MHTSSQGQKVLPVLKDKKCKPVLKDKKSHLNPTKVLQTPSSLTTPGKQTTKQQPTLPKQKTTPVTTHPSTQENHLFYQCHLHQPDKQSLQDHHHTTTGNTITNNALQDHLQQQTTPITTARSIIPKPRSRIPQASTYKTSPTCTRTINTASIYIFTCLATLPKPFRQPTTVHTCSVRIKNEEKMQPHTGEKVRHFTSETVKLHKVTTFII